MAERLTFPKGLFDELVAENVSVHIERMDGRSLHLSIWRPDDPSGGYVFHGTIGGSRGRVTLFVNDTTLPQEGEPKDGPA